MEVLKSLKISAEWPEFTSKEDREKGPPVIKCSIRLYLVDDVEVTPNSASVYNHPSNKELISVKQGSGYYRVGLNTKTVADVRYVELTRQVEILPLLEGELVITLEDLCLASRPTQINVRVVSVASLHVDMDDKVEITKSIPVVVRLYDERHELINVPDMDMVHLEITVEDPLINLRLMESENLGEIHFTATGKSLPSQQ